MGSAAFLNEAMNQLAEAYLERKQKEMGQSISHEDYAHEKQKVKMFLADRNVFGVDLNPVAVELAEVSLWLNTIHAGAYVPWFGMQLACGNSLIGARRQVFAARLLRRGDKQDPLWLDEVPQRIMPGEQRREERSLSLPPAGPGHGRLQGQGGAGAGAGGDETDQGVAQGLHDALLQRGNPPPDGSVRRGGPPVGEPHPAAATAFGSEPWTR